MELVAFPNLRKNHLFRGIGASQTTDKPGDNELCSTYSEEIVRHTRIPP